MFLQPSRLRTSLTLGAALAGALGLFVLRAHTPALAEAPPAYDPPPMPPGVDSMVSLEEIDARVSACAEACRAAVYLWTPRMPLSRMAIPSAVDAARRLGIEFVLADHDDLALSDGASEVERALLAAGALTHAPALVLFADGAAVGSAILGYKSEAAYVSLLQRRSAETGALPANVSSGALGLPGAVERASRAPAEYEAVGLPGAYFRWIAGRNTVAYESDQRIWFLDLESGESRMAPGFIDFIPTPDGRYFVTPAPGGAGLEFYDATQVFDVVESGRIGEIEPIFTDLRMRDQYPSIGILERSATRTLYRVLTSWFDTVVYRDYDVRVDPRTGASSVQPIGEAVRPCSGMSLSTPIMSQDGTEIAARDEATGTTKIFRIVEDGLCEIEADFGVPTSKVAWHASGRRLAFSIPRRGRGPGDPEFGIFVLDRDGPSLTHIEGSEAASRLAFPDFVGGESLIYMVPGMTLRDTSLFRVVDLP